MDRSRPRTCPRGGVGGDEAAQAAPGEVPHRRVAIPGHDVQQRPDPARPRVGLGDGRPAERVGGRGARHRRTAEQRLERRRPRRRPGARPESAPRPRARAPPLRPRRPSVRRGSPCRRRGARRPRHGPDRGPRSGGCGARRARRTRSAACGRRRSARRPLRPPDRGARGARRRGRRQRRVAAGAHRVRRLPPGWPPNRARICPRGSPSCMPWQLVQVSGPRIVQGDCKSPWYSYAVRRGVPSAQKRAAKACRSPRRGVSRHSGALSIARVVAGDERIAVRQQRPDLVGDPLPVAAAAQIGGARRRQARRVHDRRVGGGGVHLKRPAAQRVAVAGDVLRARPVAGLAGDAQLGDGGGEPPAVADRAPGWARRCGRRRSCRSSA